MGHSLCVWVHLHTGSMAKRHYRVKRMKTAVRNSCHYVLLLSGYLLVTGFRAKSHCWPSFSFPYTSDVEWLTHGQSSGVPSISVLAGKLSMAISQLTFIILRAYSQDSLHAYLFFSFPLNEHSFFSCIFYFLSSFQLIDFIHLAFSFNVIWIIMTL